jgi:hypothetical protein
MPNYVVVSKGEIDLFNSSNKQKAVDYYLAHKNANLVEQRFPHTTKGQAVILVFQPKVKDFVKHRKGTILRRFQLGFFTQSQAKTISDNHRKAGQLARCIKSDKGYQVYAEKALV